MAEAHQQKRLWQGERRIPAMGVIVGAWLAHRDHIDEAAAPTEQKLPEIRERWRLTEQQTQRRNIYALLAVCR